MSGRVVVGLVSVVFASCSVRNWVTGASMVASEREVALALGEPDPGLDSFDMRSIPTIPAPQHVRPCCAFGADLGVTVDGKVVPGYRVENIKAARELGRHEYDKGALSLSEDLSRFATSENNGLVYTCRGGFIDTAHVRDYADLTLFLTMKFILQLERGVTFELPGDGATRVVQLAPVPPEVIAQHGRWTVAIALAQWTAWRFSLWHEVVTWYGLESVRGFSEKASAFSPEDLYSNALGIRLAGGILSRGVVRSRADWDGQMDAWLRQALVRLGDLPEKTGRAVMRQLDGRWWDSGRTLPDFRLVKRRNFELSTPIRPWRLEDTGGPLDVAVANLCSAGPLPLPLPEQLGEQPLSSFLSLRFVVGPWAPPEFQLAADRTVPLDDLPRRIDEVRRAAREALGEGFDAP